MDSDESRSRTPSTRSVHDAASLTHGGGMRATRAFPTNAHAHLDPFVLFERFHIEPDQGFAAHPHAGFEILTYMLQGGMAHGDSLGHETTARAGDAMRITAGREIRHSEFPADETACSGLQLWVNLPRDRTQIDPSYADASSDDLPTEERAGATVTTVVGEGSPIALETPLAYLDVTVTDSWTWEPPAARAGFCFVVSGSGTLEGADTSLETGQFVTLEAGVEDSLVLTTDSECRIVAVAGDPHGEAIRQRGPIVA